MNELYLTPNLPKQPATVIRSSLTVAAFRPVCVERRYKHPFFQCRSRHCPQHRHRWQSGVTARLLGAATDTSHNWFIVLPVGPLISNADWTAVWSSFRERMQYRYGQFEYFRILKTGRRGLHAHVLAKTTATIEQAVVRAVWSSALHKHAGIDLAQRRVYCRPLMSWAGSAHYLPRIEEQEGLPPRGHFSRIVQSSWRFWSV